MKGIEPENWVIRSAMRFWRLALRLSARSRQTGCCGSGLVRRTLTVYLPPRPPPCGCTVRPEAAWRADFEPRDGAEERRVSGHAAVVAFFDPGRPGGGLPDVLSNRAPPAAAHGQHRGGDHERHDAGD